MINFTRIFVVLLVIFLLNACTSITVGRDFDLDLFASKIEQGITTQATIKSWLGEPTSTGVSLATDKQLFDEWTYYFAKGKLSDTSAASIKLLQIKFDKEGVVRSYNWSASK